MQMYPQLLAVHSYLRWAILVFILISIIKSLAGWLGNKPYTKIDNQFSLFTLIFVHLQLLLGLGLYFISPYVQLNNMSEVMGSDTLRFWTIEHILVMLIGIVFITIGRIKAKKARSSLKKHKTTAIFYITGLILILSRIPWPFMAVARDWI